jgi:hypothetical protein
MWADKIRNGSYFSLSGYMTYKSNGGKIFYILFMLNRKNLGLK